MFGFFFPVRCGCRVSFVSRVAVAGTMTCAVLFVKLLGAVRAIEIMAFAGNGKDGSGHE